MKRVQQTEINCASNVNPALCNNNTATSRFVLVGPQKRPRLQQQSAPALSHTIVYHHRPAQYAQAHCVISSSPSSSLAQSSLSISHESQPQSKPEDIAKNNERIVLKCARFFMSLMKYKDYSSLEQQNVLQLLREGVTSEISAEEFSAKLTNVTGSRDRGTLAPFLQTALPFLRISVRNGEQPELLQVLQLNGGGMHLSSAPASSNSANLPTLLASITLTRDHLKQLNKLFAGPEQFEHFSTAVSGCLVRIDRQAIGHKSDLIAQIAGLVKPMQIQDLSLPNRRIFVVNLGYFEFDHLVQQMPDRTDYGAWINDMEMQSLPLPSDAFLRVKALALRELRSRANTNVAGRSIANEGATKAEEGEGLMDGREEEHNGGGQFEEGEIAAEPENRQKIVCSTVSEMSATSSSSAAMEKKVIHISSNTVCVLDDEETAEADQNGETGLRQECSAAAEPTSTSGLSMAVASPEHLRIVQVPLFMVHLLAEHNAGDCLRGCLMICFDSSTKKIITDEIDQVTAAGGIRFKHSRRPYLIKDLQNRTINYKLFNQWIEKMAKWGEPLPLMDVYKKRRENLDKNCSRIAKQFSQEDERRLKIEERLLREMDMVRKLETQMLIEREKRSHQQNLIRETYQQKLLSNANEDACASSSSSDDDDEAVDQATGELPMDKLVHTKELLDGVSLSYDIVQILAQYPAKRHFLSGCFVKCRTRSTNETIIDAIAEVSTTEIRFKHIEQPFLLEELCILTGEISDEMFTKWIEDMTRWDEPLPSIRVYSQYKKCALLARKSAKRNNRRRFKTLFAKDTRQIVVDPGQLVQLHQLGEAEFTRVVTGLFVLVLYSIDNSKTISVEQIRAVSFDHPAYTMYGKSLTIRLHFEHPTAAPVPILNVQFVKKGDHRQLTDEQHPKQVGHFVPPSPEFIRLKSEELQFALSITPEIV